MPILGTIASSTRQGLSTTAFWALDSYTFPNASANTVTFNSIPQDYKHLMIVFQGAGTINDGTRLRFNGDSGASSYFGVSVADGFGSSQSTSLGITTNSMSDIFSLLGNSYGAQASTAGVAWVNDYTNTVKLKTCTAYQANLNSSNEGGVWVASGMYLASTAAVTSLSLTARTQNFDTGSTIAIFGIK
jgi:hypothetical protein